MIHHSVSQINAFLHAARIPFVTRTGDRYIFTPPMPPKEDSSTQRAPLPGLFDITDRAAMDVLRNPSACGLFEVIRRIADGATHAELVTATALPAHQVRMLADQLASIGLVKATRKRGQPARLRATCQQITIHSDPTVAAEASAVRRHFLDSTADAARELRAALAGGGFEQPHFSKDGRFFLDSLVKFEFSREEWIEFSKVLWQVFDHLASRAMSRTASRPGDIRLCDHVIAITIAPTSKPVLPGPVIRSSSRPRREAPASPMPQAAPGELTPRERAIAGMIAAGTARRDIAKRLGLSENTVATFAKRAYAKLGVHSRRELAHRLARPTMHDSPD
jgi:DNA-binding CsgD family transcriptional regulator